MTPSTSYILGLLLLSTVSGSTVTEPGGEVITSTPRPAEPVLERRHDSEDDSSIMLDQRHDSQSYTTDVMERRHDSQAEASAVTSFSSVVIHHPVVGKGGSGPPTTSQWTIESHKDGETVVSTNRGPGRAASRHSTRDSSRNQQQPQQQQDASTQRGTPPSRQRSRGQTRTNSFDTVSTRSPDSGLLKTGKNYYRITSLQDNGEGVHSVEPPVHKDYIASTVGPQYSQGIQSPQPPPGMTDELMQSLLNQQPQKFDYGFKTTNNYQRSVTVAPESLKAEQPARPTRKPQKKYKGQVQSEAAEKAKKRLQSQKRPDTFNVGYSIGFGNSPNPQEPQPHSFQSQQAYQDVILGKPKGSNPQIQVNGANTVWKEVQPGLEISQEGLHGHSGPHIPVHSFGHETYSQQEVGLVNGHPGTPFYLVSGLGRPEVANVPTAGQSSFNHDYAIGHSNTFDLSNAVAQPFPGSVSSPQSKQDTAGIKRPRLHQNKKSKFPESQALVNAHTTSIPIIPQPIGIYPYSLDFHKQPYSGTAGLNSNFVVTSPTGKIPHHLSGKQDQPMHGFDLSGLMGVGTPVPIQNVYIPGQKQGEGKMVPAIVIPLSQLAGFENFGTHSFPSSVDNKDNYGYSSDVFSVVPPPSLNLKSSGFGNMRQHTPRHNMKGRTKGEKNKGNDSSKQASFVSPSFGDASPMLKQPSNRNARLVKMQKELNSILAEEMYRKNHPSRSYRG